MEAFIGTVMLFGGNYAPQGWMFCQGQLLPINQYAALFSLLGTTYGGDGRTNFALPDLRGRAPIGFSQGPGLTNYALGAKGGVETVTLAQNQIPAHTHAATQANSTVSGGSITGATVTIQAATNAATHQQPANGDYLAASETGGGEVVNSYAPTASGKANLQGGTVSGGSITGATVANGAITLAATGGNQPHENRQPFLAMNYIICLEGIYPSHP